MFPPIGAVNRKKCQPPGLRKAPSHGRRTGARSHIRLKARECRRASWSRVWIRMGPQNHLIRRKLLKDRRNSRQMGDGWPIVPTNPENHRYTCRRSRDRAQKSRSLPMEARILYGSETAANFIIAMVTA